MDRNRHYCSFVGHCYIADDRIIKVSNKFENRCDLNVFIVQWDPVTLYPEGINKKTSAASCARWEQNRCYCAAMITSHTHCCYFARCSSKVKGFFFCQYSVAAFLGVRRTYGWVTRWEAVILNYECSIRRVLPV